jgi:CBS domain-containing protein
MTSWAMLMNLVHEILLHKERVQRASNSIWSVAPSDSVFTAIARMAEHEVGALLVFDDDRLMGIISERDYARKVILKEKASKLIPVSEIMTHKVISVGLADHIDECVNLMKENHIRHLPVIDGGAVVGMLSLRDLFSATIEEQATTIEHLEHYIRGEV